MPDQYQVVFTGKLVPNVGTEQAARDFAAVFKVPEEKAWRLVLSNTEHVLKKEIDLNNAERYRHLLEEIGLRVRVEPMPAVAPAPDPSFNPDPDAGGPDAAAWNLSKGAVSAPPDGDGPANPYAPPTADLTPLVQATGAGGPLTGPYAMPAGHGWEWITRGFDLFKQAPLPWIGAFLVYIVILMVASLIPFIGGLISNLFGPVLLGGLMYAADRQARGHGFEVGNLFHGFSTRLGPLVALGALYLLAVFAVAILFAIIAVAVLAGAAGFDPAALEQNPELLFQTIGPFGLILILLAMLMFIPLIMAYWFAPTLVMLNDMAPIAALKLSFDACLQNILPFVIYGLIGMLLFIIGAIPLALGLLIVGPVMFAANYAAYRDIFFDQGPSRTITI